MSHEHSTHSCRLLGEYDAHDGDAVIAKKPGLVERKPTPEQVRVMERINAIAQRHVPDGSRIVDEFLLERQRDACSISLRTWS